MGKGARSLQTHVHVGELALDELVVGDGGVELFAGVGVGEDEVESGLHDTEEVEISELSRDL